MNTKPTPHTEAPAAQDEREPTNAMVTAYLAANDAYWKGVDELPQKIGTWRSGTPAEATRVSLRAALAARAPQAAAEGQADQTDALEKALAECRDAFPIPEPGHPLEGDWTSAMSDPLSVPEYVRACVAQAAPAPQPEAAIRCDSTRLEPQPDIRNRTSPEAAESRITITLRQAEKLVAFFGGHDAEITIAPSDIDSHSGPGLYAWCTDYPEEGSEFLGLTEVDDDLAMNGRAAEPVAAPVQAEPLFLLHCGQIDSSGEQDDWDIEADSWTRVEEFCRLHPGQTIGLYATPPVSVERDAARYRWLRDVGDATWRPFGIREGYSAAEADAAIDAALAGHKEQQP